MIHKLITFTCAALLLGVVMPVAADSLWPQNSSCNLVADVKARTVGDLVTVLITEGTEASLAATTDVSKDFKHSNNAGIGPLVKLVPEIGYTSSQSGKASGQTTMSNNLVTKLTATVTNVLPNGNLQIKGERAIVTNGEKQTATLSATVRPQDIATDNTVVSTFLADVNVQCTGKGAVANRQKEGIISRLLRFLF
jgi:flagellar L-ring protein FlgH